LRRLVDHTLRDDFRLLTQRLAHVSRQSFNHTFRVDTSYDDGQYAARVGPPQRVHHDGVEALEASWLSALSIAEIPVATMIADIAGRYVVEAESTLVTGVRPVSVFTWATGRPVRDRLDTESMIALGEMLAALHDHASGWKPDLDVPNGVVANRVVSFLDDTLLAAHDSVQGNLYREAIDRAQRAIDELWLHPPHAPHLLHGDFGPHNVLRHRTAFTTIDFQDLQFGFDVQDVGLTVSDLRRNDVDPALIDALRQGYSSIRTWPPSDEQLLAALSAARSLNMLNLGLNLRRWGFTEFFDRHTKLIRRWMASGDGR
jgi:Ser/Thr protein kinase RdoA (MazF antagonist)